MADIRLITERDERIDARRILHDYAFGTTPPVTSREEMTPQLDFVQDHPFLGIYEGDDLVGVGCYGEMIENVRGAMFPISGIWGVMTRPEARRKGYVRQLIGEMLAHSREAGHPFSTLYPFRESFYQRMGWVRFPYPRVARFAPRPLHPLLDWDLGGSVRYLPISEGFEAWRAFLQQVQPHQHGMGLWHETMHRYIAHQDKHWLALAEVDGETVGAMLYAIKDRDDKDGRRMAVRYFYSTTPQGRYLLLEWFARHIDQVEDVQITLPPDARPGTWFADLEVEYRSGWSPMGRVLDVAQIGGMQVGPGAFTAHITDAMCRWNEGVWRFESVEGTLHVEPTDSADCTLSIQALSALVYGTHDPASFALRGWGDPTPAVEMMFPQAAPFLHHEF